MHALWLSAGGSSLTHTACVAEEATNGRASELARHHYDLLQRGTTCCNAAQPVATRRDLLQRGRTGCNAARPVAARQDRLQRGTACAGCEGPGARARHHGRLFRDLGDIPRRHFMRSGRALHARATPPPRRVADPRFPSCSRSAAPLCAPLARLLHASSGALRIIRTGATGSFCSFIAAARVSRRWPPRRAHARARTQAHTSTRARRCGGSCR